MATAVETECGPVCMQNSGDATTRGIASCCGANHGVENGDEFLHRSRERHFLEFFLRQQSLIDGFDRRIESRGNECCHVQRAENGVMKRLAITLPLGLQDPGTIDLQAAAAPGRGNAIPVQLFSVIKVQRQIKCAAAAG